MANPTKAILTPDGVQQVTLKGAELTAYNQAVANFDAEATQRAESARRNAAKIERQALVENIKVTTAAGKTFDGDETSQNRMARAILAMQAAGVTLTRWVLADNTPAEVTAAELAEALALAGAAQSEIWVIE